MCLLCFGSTPWCAAVRPAVYTPLVLNRVRHICLCIPPGSLLPPRSPRKCTSPRLQIWPCLCKSGHFFVTGAAGRAAQAISHPKTTVQARCCGQQALLDAAVEVVTTTCAVLFTRFGCKQLGQSKRKQSSDHVLLWHAFVLASRASDAVGGEREARACVTTDATHFGSSMRKGARMTSAQAGVTHHKLSYYTATCRDRARGCRRFRSVSTWSACLCSAHFRARVT